MNAPRTRPTRSSTLVPLHAVAFIAGSAVMVLEILGTRIIGPVTAMNALLPASVWLNTTVHDR